MWFVRLPDLAKVDIIKSRLFYVISAPRGLPVTGAARDLFKRRATTVAKELKSIGDEHKGSFPDPDGQLSEPPRDLRRRDLVSQAAFAWLV